MASKLSPRLQMLLDTSPDRLRAVDGLKRYAVDATTDQPRFNVIVEHDGDAAALVTAGLVLRSRTAGRFATGTATAEAIRRIEALPTVRSITAPHRVDPELNVAVPAIRADRAQRDGVGGTGALAGIIDVGINWRHPDFRNPDGTTRILAIWDQTLTPANGEAPPANFTYGVEYTSAMINAALLTSNPPVPIRTTDGPSGHGTHVAGIAAGNGRALGDTSGHRNFSGVSPLSRLIVVRLRAGASFEDDVIDGVNYLAEKSSALGRPLAINMSFGKKLGPHDGRSHFERQIDAVLERALPGFVIIKSAGNEASAGHHIQATIDTHLASVVPVDLAAGEKHVEIELWYARDDRLDVTVLDPTGKESVTVAAGGNDSKIFASGDQLTIRSTIGEAETGDNLVTIILSRLGATPQATWMVLPQAQSLLPIRVDGWLEGNTPATRFLGAHVSRYGTITEPGNAKRIITVGAYVTKTTGYGVGIGSIADFSSRGPTRDGRTKPDVTAPGDYIDAPNAAYDPQAPGTVSPYVGMSGTSMAAPMITGSATLLLEADPRLLQATAKSLLEATATADAETGTVPNTIWGYGKVDTAAAVSMAREQTAASLPPPPVVQPQPAAPLGEGWPGTPATTARPVPAIGRKVA